MRCKNCHTVMMDTDTECMSCHASVESATAGPPELTGDKPNGLLLMLPLFGGLLGALVYAGLTASQSGGGSRRGGRSSGEGVNVLKTLKILLGVFFILGGGLFMIVAFVQYKGVNDVAQRSPTVATPAELRTRSYVANPPSWVSYTFEEAKPIDEVITRRRGGHGGEVHAKAILVKVETRWLVATVTEDFDGNELVGKIMPVDSPISQPLIERVRKEQDDPRSILPYEFFAVEGCPSDQQFRYSVSRWMGGIGLAAFLAGLYFLFGGLGGRSEE